ncbi:hypothetical protein EDD30_5983 [Couchioplanes caeruleus]|uniref:Uncharacterized protein n=2 Tax=Couchioplanes caeruleus TaxID=56438 RepID=A0A1K0FSN5_9ACTN|nr:hypothetical protein BG844_02590 [Couchioplanes caeruleus subsp. caeruleus]ROP33017.1 hypothetical protein EDD30_5983 [Couchioplanes caeruleus]
MDALASGESTGEPSSRLRPEIGTPQGSVGGDESRYPPRPDQEHQPWQVRAEAQAPACPPSPGAWMVRSRALTMPEVTMPDSRQSLDAFAADSDAVTA